MEMEWVLGLCTTESHVIAAYYADICSLIWMNNQMGRQLLCKCAALFDAELTAGRAENLLKFIQLHSHIIL